MPKLFIPANIQIYHIFYAGEPVQPTTPCTELSCYIEWGNWWVASVSRIVVGIPEHDIVFEIDKRDAVRV